MKVNPINNNQTSFGAKMQVSGALNKARWSNIAKEFEAKTSSVPDYKVELKEALNAGLMVSVLKEGDKKINLLEHVFSLGGTDKLLDLSDNSITQKIMKLLDIAKYNYKVITEIPNDIQKLENEYGIKIDDRTRCSLETTIRWEANDKIRAAINDDPILSDYISFMRMTSKDGSSCTAHRKTLKI